MSHGHVTGLKKEKRGSQDWYRARQEELLRQIESRQRAQQPKAQSK